MKKAFVILILIIAALQLVAQQEPQFNQYMFDKVMINPAAAGIKRAINATGTWRDQWIGYKDDSTGNAVNPRTFGISLDMPVYAIKSGAGLTFRYNNTGAEKNIDVKLQYAYHVKIKRNQLLSFGLSVGVFNKTIDYSKVTPSEFDPLLDGLNSESGTMTDIGFGAHYEFYDKFFAGISASNLLGSSAEIGAPEFNLARHYYFYGGYHIDIRSYGQEDFILTPGLLVKATNGSTNVEISALLSYPELIWCGVMYRYQDAVGLMGGIQYEGFRVGVSYDYTFSSGFAKGARHSVELLVQYAFPLSPRIARRSGYNTRNM